MNNDWIKNYKISEKKLEENLQYQFFIIDDKSQRINDESKRIGIRCFVDNEKKDWQITDIKIKSIEENNIEQSNHFHVVDDEELVINIEVDLLNINSDNYDNHPDNYYPLTIDFVLTKISSIVSSWLGSNQARNIFTMIKVDFKLKNSKLLINEKNILLTINTKATVLTLNKKIKLSEDKDFIWIFNKKIDVLLEEYKNLRQQIITIANSLTNIFYYGVLTLGIVFTAIQGILNQYGNLNSQEKQYIYFEQFEIQFSSLSSLLKFLLLIFLPAICIVFTFKWLSNAKSIGVKGYFVTKLELELNRAFNKFVVLNQNEHNEHPFSDYELNIGWETNLRRLRRSVGDQSIIFGNTHMVLVILFFVVVAIVSQIMGFYLFYENNLIFYIYFGIAILAISVAFWKIFQNYQENEKWYLALSNSKIFNFSKKAPDNSISKCLQLILEILVCLLICVFIIYVTLAISKGNINIFSKPGIYSSEAQYMLIEERIINALSQEEYRAPTLLLLYNKLQLGKTLNEQEEILKYFPTVNKKVDKNKPSSQDIFKYFYNLRILGYWNDQNLKCSYDQRLDLNNINFDDILKKKHKDINYKDISKDGICLELPKK